MGDALRLNQILTNLANNAIKFAHEGKVQLDIGLIASADEVVTLQFRIKDSGIGMSQSQMDLLFSPFTKADSSTTRNYGGTGLGLAICKQFA